MRLGEFEVQCCSLIYVHLPRISHFFSEFTHAVCRLEAHNVRRKDWHERHNKEYVPMVWSMELASDAQSWAEALLNDCDIDGISHESDVEEGGKYMRFLLWVFFFFPFH